MNFILTRNGELKKTDRPGYRENRHQFWDDPPIAAFMSGSAALKLGEGRLVQAVTFTTPPGRRGEKHHVVYIDKSLLDLAQKPSAKLIEAVCNLLEQVV